MYSGNKILVVVNDERTCYHLREVKPHTYMLGLYDNYDGLIIVMNNCIIILIIVLYSVCHYLMSQSILSQVALSFANVIKCNRALIQFGIATSEFCSANILYYTVFPYSVTTS